MNPASLQSLPEHRDLSSLLCGVVKEEDLSLINGSGSISGLSLDSRNLQKGELFLAVPGLKVDGRQYAEKAMGAGAKAVLFESNDAPEACRKL
ncbi:MAG: Mur ligase domain-containing protein, partial [bacterium]